MLVNDLMAEYFPTNEQIESRAVVHAFGLLAAVGDAKAAKLRLGEIVAATKEYAEQRAAAERVVAEAAAKSGAAEAADTDLAKRTEQSQTWVNGTERLYREREARILANEELHAQRERELAGKEADLASRLAAHESAVRRLKELA